MSPTYESIFKVLKKFSHALTAREICDNAEHEGTTATYGMALHALAQDGGPLTRKRDVDTGAFLYELRDGVTLADMKAPARGPRDTKPPVVEAKAETPRVVGVSPANAITSPAPIRADELTRKAPEAPATARTVKPMDDNKTPDGAKAPSAAPAKENPGATEAPRDTAPKVVSIAKPEKTGRPSRGADIIGTRIAELQQQLVRIAVSSSDPLVASIGNRLEELQNVLRSMQGRDAA